MNSSPYVPQWLDVLNKGNDISISGLYWALFSLGSKITRPNSALIQFNEALLNMLRGTAA